jgi:hypothetical protein
LAAPESSRTEGKRTLINSDDRPEEGRKVIRAYGHHLTSKPQRATVDPIDDLILTGDEVRMDGKLQYELALKTARKADRNGGDLPITLLRESASAGYPPALYALASWHLHGKGVRKDFKKAVALLKKAADKKYVPAEYDLAVSYELGQGVRKNFKAALVYYRRAANDGDADAAAEVARCYFHGIGTIKNMSEAAVWYLKAAERGDAEAQYAIARAFELGEGVAQDMSSALAWYRRAAGQGNRDAADAVRAIVPKATRMRPTNSPRGGANHSPPEPAAHSRQTRLGNLAASRR